MCVCVCVCVCVIFKVPTFNVSHHSFLLEKKLKKIKNKRN